MDGQWNEEQLEFAKWLLDELNGWAKGNKTYWLANEIAKRDTLLGTHAYVMHSLIIDIARYMGSLIMRSDAEELILARCRQVLTRIEDE